MAILAQQIQIFPHSHFARCGLQLSGPETGSETFSPVFGAS